MIIQLMSNLISLDLDTFLRLLLQSLFSRVVREKDLTLKSSEFISAVNITVYSRWAGILWVLLQLQHKEVGYERNEALGVSGLWLY